MKLLALASICVLGLAACGGSEQPPAQARDTVDACYQEQAEAYEAAARLAESTIQENMPVILDGVADTVEANSAMIDGLLGTGFYPGMRQDRRALMEAHQTIQEASEQMLTAGRDFGGMMGRAEALCN